MVVRVAAVVDRGGSFCCLEKGYGLTAYTNNFKEHQEDARPADSHLTVAAAIITDSDGSVLTVRKRNSSFWILPGGKPEKDESKHQTVARELREELGISINETSIQFLGRVSGPAANEKDTIVVAYLYDCTISEPIKCSAEIADKAWINPHYPTCSPGTHIAPLLSGEVFPILSRKN